MAELTKEIKKCREETLKHRVQVRKYMLPAIAALVKRAVMHDDSKLESPEVEVFAEYTPKLATATYGSEEYKSFLKEMQVALDHHYKENRHHPEHFENGVCGMTLLDLLEMICDWKAATLRHNDGDIRKSIEINAERFNLDSQLKQILLNTVEALEEMAEAAPEYEA